MKKITILLVIIFTFLFSNTSWGESNLLTESNMGKFYYDKDRVRKSGKYLYFWELQDYIKPQVNSDGEFSSTLYVQLDCSIFRYKWLKIINYKNSMGEGGIVSQTTPTDEWRYPPPNSIGEFVYNKVCEEHK